MTDRIVPPVEVEACQCLLDAAEVLALCAREAVTATDQILFATTSRRCLDAAFDIAHRRDV